MFTVLIPTFNRPHLLRNALLSVSQQVAFAHIDKVIVSENGLNRNSELVCSEFPSLEIAYFFHETQMPVLVHLQWILSQVDNGYGAMLCDDDWWDIHHLSLAKDSLLLYENNVAYFANHAFSKSVDTFKNAYSEWNRVMHFGVDRFQNFKPTVYNKDEIFTFCSLITPFHFSALICKGEVLKDAVKIFEIAHPTFSDRILFPLIASYGDVIYNPLVTAIVLFHPGMDGNTYAKTEWKIERQRGTLEVIARAAYNGIDVKHRLNKIYEEVNDDDKLFILNELNDIFYDKSYLKWFIDYDKVIDINEKRRLSEASEIAYQNSFKKRLLNLTRSIYNRT